MNRDAKGFISTDTTTFDYETKPPMGTKVCLLTTGKVCILGYWSDSAGYIAWAPLPGRDKEKERGLGL